MVNELNNIKDVESLSEKIDMLNSIVVKFGNNDNEDIMNKIDDVFRDIVFLIKILLKKI